MGGAKPKPPHLSGVAREGAARGGPGAAPAQNEWGTKQKK